MDTPFPVMAIQAHRDRTQRQYGLRLAICMGGWPYANRVTNGEPKTAAPPFSTQVVPHTCGVGFCRLISSVRQAAWTCRGDRGTAVRQSGKQTGRHAGRQAGVPECEGVRAGLCFVGGSSLTGMPIVPGEQAPPQQRGHTRTTPKSRYITVIRTARPVYVRYRPNTQKFNHT